MRDIKKELESYEETYNDLMHLFYCSRIGLGEDVLIAEIKNGDDYTLKLLCYVELRRNRFTAKEILNDVKLYPSKEDMK